jgi:hypothetical protein
MMFIIALVCCCLYGYCTVNITEVACPIRYSIDDLKAYEQKSINTVDSNGNTLSVGACLDSGVSRIYAQFGAINLDPNDVHNCIGLLLFVRVLCFQLNQSGNLL